MKNQDYKHITQQVILRAEDDEHVSCLLDLLLQRQGYHVMPANDGKQLLDLIREALPPDLVLLDIMLPFIDGYEFIRQVRMLKDWQSVPIIVLSSLDGEDDIVRAFKAGANDYITKPFQPMELMARIENLLGRQHEQSSSEA